MLFVSYLLCFLSLLANHRTLSEEEAHAFRTLFGTDDIDKLKEIEQKPLQFWQEREKALMQEGATISHLEFCARVVQEAKDCILKDCPEELKGLCQQRFIEIDHIIEEVLPEDPPILPNARACYYSHLCDKVHKAPIGIREVVFASRKSTFQDINDIAYGYADMTHDFNEKVRWKLSKDGQFSLFDYLVMRHKGFYLCGAPESPLARFDFLAHGRVFTGWWGIFEHDTYAHSCQQSIIDTALERYDISSQQYFNECCNPECFITGDLIDTSHKILGWFYQFHELPSTMNSFATNELCSLIFPHTGTWPGNYHRKACWSNLESHAQGFLTDTGFLDIVPYFMHVPLKYDWHTKPLPRHLIQNYAKSYVHEALLGWRAQNCAVGFDFLPANNALDYFRVFYFHFSFITPVDWQRDSRFFRQMLFSLYNAEKELSKTKRFVCFSDFEKNVEEDVQEFLRKVAPMKGDLLVEAPSYFIFVLNTKYAALCQEITDKNNSHFIFKHGQNAFHTFVKGWGEHIRLEMELNVAVDEATVSVEKNLCKKQKAAS